MLDINKVELEIEGIDETDYPEFSKAYIKTGFIENPFGDVRRITTEEIDYIQKNHRDIIKEFVLQTLAIEE